MANANENAAKDKTMELAEASRESEWKFPSFTAELFAGNFRWDLLSPYPEQSAEEKRIGDEYIEKLRGVLIEHVNPDKLDDTGEYPQEALDALAAIGVFGMTIPTEYGGLGFSKVNYCRVLHFLGSYCQNTLTWVSAHLSIGCPQPLKMFGTDEQKKKYLPRLAAGEISAFALTERDVGSDPAKMSTTAIPSDDGEYYLLNGEKLWITNGTAAGIVVVMAKTPPKIVHGKERMQISTFIVETDRPGFSITQRCEFMGLKTIANGILKFDNMKIPKENLIGKEGQGLRIALTTLNTGRLGLPAGAVGASKALLQECQTWIKERVQWGVPIGKHQHIARLSANIAADTFAMESIVWLASSWADKGNADIRLEAAAAKYFCTETMWRIIDDFVQIRGGRGYETAASLHERGDRPIAAERWLRDARIGRIFEGSSQVMHLIMAREAMDTHFKMVMPILQPKPGQKESKMSLLIKAGKYYAKWYPKLFLPSTQNYNVQYLNPINQAYLPWIEKRTRRVARTLFHTMGKYKEKLEFEQVILGNFVDIGVDLFVMAGSLAFAEMKLANNPADQTPQELADLFCKNAKERIERNFNAIKHNHNSTFNNVADTLMDEKFEWMYSDIFGDLPPFWKDVPMGEAAAVNTQEEAVIK
jgi:hypothetical protein